MTTETLSFRIDPDTRLLLEVGAKRAGKKLSDYCREIIASFIYGNEKNEIEQLKGEVEALKQELEETRAALIIKRGGRPRKLKDDEATNAKIIEMYQSGNSLLSISKEMNMAYSTIYRICKKYQ